MSHRAPTLTHLALFLCLPAGPALLSQPFATTTVQGTVYQAGGAPVSGTLLLSWPPFTTAASQAVAAGRLTVPIAADGTFSVALAPNAGSTPAGLYYTAVYHLNDGATSTEYWTVPSTSPASLAQVRAQLLPAAQAVQAVSKSYVDQAIQQIALRQLNFTGGSVTGPLSAPTLTASVNRILQVTAPPYNAFCDAALQSASISVSASGVTSGYAFTSADVGKRINFGSTFLSTLSGGTPIQFSAVIRSVTGGNATLSAAPSAAFTTTSWNLGHDDTAAVQAAFNDAASSSQPVQFPAGTCMVGTIAYRGQSFFGAGPALTTVLGLPGQDVFAGPDTPFTYPYEPSIHDLAIAVDSSLNAAASAAGGNNTFPNRITGTLGGLAPASPALNVGPVLWSPQTSGMCGAAINAGSTSLALACGDFNTPPLPSLASLPITIRGAGPAGGDLTTTIASYLSPTQVTLATPASTTVTSASGSWGSTMNPPWYIGNCGFAIPQSDQSVKIGNFNGAVFKNLIFTSVNPPYSRANHTCGMFFQDQPYDIHLEKVDFSNLYGGYIEALPALNFTQPWAWTPDTSTYKDINVKFAFLPMVWYNGSHRVLDGLSIYSAGAAYSLGLLQFATPNGYPGATITHYYHECWSGNSGELARFSTSGANTDNITAGHLQQCNSPQYVNWLASNSTVDAGLLNLVIAGNANTFRHLEVGSIPVSVTDNGFDNIAETNQLYYSAKRAFANRPKEPANKLDASFLETGNSTTPYTGGSDLLITCNEFNFAVQNGSNPPALCTPDPAGSEITRSYMHELLSSYPTGWKLGAAAGQGNGPYGKLLLVGDRIPQAKVTLAIQSRCDQPCGRDVYLKDGTTTLAHAVFTYGTAWSVQTMLVDLSAVPLGDQITVQANQLVQTGSSPVTYADIAFVGFAPVNADTITAAVTDPRIPAQIQTGTAGNPPQLNAASWYWASRLATPDPASPVGYSTYLTNGSALTSIGSNANLNGGSLYPAVNSTVSFTVQGPPIWTDTLSSAQTSASTTAALTTAITAAWPSGGCFLVDQEIECWTGAPTLGATTLTVTRAQYGTLAQPHASGATYVLIGTGQGYVACNGTNIATLNLAFEPNWTAWSAPFPAQNCSGSPTTFKTSFLNGPTGQQYKLAAITIAQQPNLAGTTASLGGSSLSAGACLSATAGVANTAPGMVAAASPATYPGDAFTWKAYVSATNTVTVKLCNTSATAATPAATTYAVRVLQ